MENLQEEKKLTPASALRKFFEPITAKEILEFKKTDPEGYTELAGLCLQHYQK